MALLREHQHGKSRVRLGRAWREGAVHHFVEWAVDTSLLSDMAHAYTQGSNAGMTATDTQKNTVYYVAKQCAARCSPEEYATRLARHFVDTYPKVSKATVTVEEAPWRRVTVDGRPHSHGYAATGGAVHTARVEAWAGGRVSVVSGVKEWRVLKATQSGYEGFLRDRFTLLPETRERILASAVTATWRYRGHEAVDYSAAYEAVLEALARAFFGPPDTGVYSPSVQFTLHEMGKAALARVPQIDSIALSMPNLHFLPCSPVTSKFEDDVYVATSEPHGTIEATLARPGSQPHSKL